MRALVLTKLFPNALEPLSSPFNRQQFDALADRCELIVLATIPWFPGAKYLRRWSAAGRVVGVPRRELIGRLEVEHPRFLYVPRLAPGANGALYVASLARRVLAEREAVDVILGSWAYPDGYAAVKLGRLLGVPSVIKLHGSDLNVVAELPGTRPRIEWALRHAGRVVAVSNALGARAIELGAPAANVDVVPNGVDRALFHPRERRAARSALGIAEELRLVVYVGRVERDKGVLDLAAAMANVAERVPNAAFALVGAGAASSEVAAFANQRALKLLAPGPRPLAEVPVWMAASDVIALPSFAEGMPNVIVEALASGRRVVASDVGGIPELVTAPELGELVPARQPSALAEALIRALRAPYEPASVVARSGIIGWAESAERLHQSLETARRAA